LENIRQGLTESKMTLGDEIKKMLIVAGASLIAYSAVVYVFDEWRPFELLNTIITDVRQGQDTYIEPLETFPLFERDTLYRDSVGFNTNDRQT